MFYTYLISKDHGNNCALRYRQADIINIWLYASHSLTRRNVFPDVCLQHGPHSLARGRDEKIEEESVKKKRVCLRHIELVSACKVPHRLLLVGCANGRQAVTVTEISTFEVKYKQ